MLPGSEKKIETTERNSEEKLLIFATGTITAKPTPPLNQTTAS
jgi:hypothetical protein